MRITIDLPDDLGRAARAIARDQGTSLSEVVSPLLRRAIGSADTAHVAASERTGMDVMHLGRSITSSDVRALDDD